MQGGGQARRRPAGVRSVYLCTSVEKHYSTVPVFKNTIVLGQNFLVPILGVVGWGVGSGTVWDRFASCTQLVARTGLPVAGGECLGAWCF